MSQFINFQEYLNSKKTLQDKPKVCDDGDNIDVPTPKAKEDPLKKKSKPRPQLKEGEQELSPFRQRLQAYLDGKQQGMVVEKPKEELVPDYHGPQETKPPAEVTKGKNWQSLHADKAGEAAPYKATAPSKPGAKGETGFGDLGDKGLVYKPDTAKAQLPKTKTEQFIDDTKGMSLGEFSNFVLAQHKVDEAEMPFVTAYQTGPIRPYPAETIRYLTALTAKSDRVMEHLIHEMRQSGQLEKLIRAVLEYPDSYKEIVGLLESGDDGLKRCSHLARALKQMTEAVGPAIGFDGEEKDDEEPEEGGKGDEEEIGAPGTDAPQEDDEEEPDLGDESAPPPGADAEEPKPLPKKPNLAKALESYGLL